MTSMMETIQDRIAKIVSEWHLDLQSLAGNKGIIAINFGAQMVYHGFELYLSGHTWHDNQDDLWLLDEKWSPIKNYISLGKESLEFDRLEILEEYENILKKDITNSKYLYHGIIVVVRLANGVVKRLK